jgi:hypothetical protein
MVLQKILRCKIQVKGLQRYLEFAKTKALCKAAFIDVQFVKKKLIRHHRNQVSFTNLFILDFSWEG